MKNFKILERYFKKDFSPKPIPKWEGLPTYSKRSERTFYPVKQWEAYIGEISNSDSRIDINQWRNLAVSGEKDSGKTTLLRGIISDHIKKTYGCQIYIADLHKSTENQIYNSSKTTIIQNYHKLITTMKEFLDFARKNQESLMMVSPRDLQHKVLVVDDVLHQVPSEKRIEFRGIIRKLMELPVDTGIRIILSAEDFSLNDSLRSLLSGFDQRICFKTSNLDSFFFMDHEDKQFLTSKGRAVWKHWDQTLYMQVFDFSIWEAKKYLSS